MVKLFFIFHSLVFFTDLGTFSKSSPIFDISEQGCMARGGHGLQFQTGQPCPTLLRPVGGRSATVFSPPPPWTPYAARLCMWVTVNLGAVGGIQMLDVVEEHRQPEDETAGDEFGEEEADGVRADALNLPGIGEGDRPGTVTRNRSISGLIHIQ
jgi:hypothetical protein